MSLGGVSKPFKFDKNKLLFADTIPLADRATFDQSNYIPGLFILDIEDVDNAKVTELIQYPHKGGVVALKPEKILASVDYNKKFIYILEGGNDYALYSLWKVNLQTKRWTQLFHLISYYTSIGAATDFSLIWMFAATIQENNDNNNNNNNKQHQDEQQREILLHIIAPEEEHKYNEECEAMEVFHSLNYYQAINSSTQVTSFSRINNERNYGSYQETSMLIPNNNNRDILQLTQATPSYHQEKESLIQKITLNVKNKNDPITFIPLFKIKPALDISNGALYVRGDTLIVLNEIHQIGDPFIQIIERCSSANQRILRKSVYAAPTSQDVHAIVLDDRKEEREIIQSFVHKYHSSSNFPSYLYLAIHQFYQTETLVIILKGSLQCGQVLFVKMEVDEILNDNQAKKLNQIPIQNQVKHAAQVQSLSN